jgi:hypothetical protein
MPTEGDEIVTFGGKFTETYLEVHIHILGSGKLEREVRAFICATGDLCRPLRAELVHGLWQAALRTFAS